MAYSNASPLRLKTLPFLIFALAATVIAQDAAKHLTDDSLFQNNCAKCHGKTAEGRHFAGPSLVVGKATAMSEEDLRNIITNGKHRMPKFGDKLTADDINRLVQEIKARAVE